MRSWLLRFLYPWHPFQGQHSHSLQPQGHSREGTRILWGGSTKELWSSNSSKPEAFFAVTSPRSLTHPGELQATTAYSTDSLLPCCDGGTTLHHQQLIGAVSSQGGPCSSSLPQLLGNRAVQHIPPSSSAKSSNSAQVP